MTIRAIATGDGSLHTGSEHPASLPAPWRDGLRRAYLLLPRPGPRLARDAAGAREGNSPCRFGAYAAGMLQRTRWRASGPAAPQGHGHGLAGGDRACAGAGDRQLAPHGIPGIDLGVIIT